MKYLIVSTYPPLKCGIGKYAFQMVKNLRKNGNVVNVLSIEGSDGDFIENLNSWFNALKILKYSVFYDKVIIQYNESIFFPEPGRINYLNILATNISLYILYILLRKKLCVIVHEISYPVNPIKRILDQILWSLCPRLIFHTDTEKEKFEKEFFKLSHHKYKLMDHQENFYKFSDISKERARHELGIPNGYIVFLCIGFIQYSKGFDRAIKAFSRINNELMRLYIVGSVRFESEEFISYINDLKKLAEVTHNTFIIEKYVSDELFDTWIIASDCIITPYRNIWSSGVAARAKLFDKPNISSNVGGLINQLGPHDILFNNDGELEYVIQRFSELLENKELYFSSNPYFSIVVPMYRGEHVSILIDKLNKQTFKDFEVIIVDSGKERENELSNISEFKLKYIYQSDIGAAKARNVGIKNARGKIIAFTDDDCQPDANWLENAKKYFERDNIIGLEGFIYTDEKKLKDPKYRIVTNLNFEGIGFMTANLFIRHYIIKNIGGFDERFDKPHFREDTDLGWRAQNFGEIKFAKDVRVYHPPHLRKIKGESKEDRDRFFINDALLFSKHPEKYIKLMKLEGHYKYNNDFWKFFFEGMSKIKEENSVKLLLNDSEISKYVSNELKK